MTGPSWRRFWLSYVLIGLCGTVFLALVVPNLNLAYVEPPPAFRNGVRRLDANPAVQRLAGAIRDVLGWHYRRPAEPAAARPPLLPAEPPAAVEALRRHFAADRAAEETPSGGATSNDNLRPVRMWGVVVRPAAEAFNKSGKFVQPLRAGTPLDIEELWRTKSGDLALCQAVTEQYTLPNVLVRLRDIDLRQGPLSAVSPREKELRCRLAELTAERDALQTERQRPPPAPDNPHAAAYLEAQNNYSNFWRRVKALEAQREAAEYDERTRLNDELARIKMSGEDVKVGKALEAAKARYQAWAAENAAPAEAEDRRLARLNLEITVLRTQLENLRDEP